MTVVGSRRMIVYDDTEPLEKLKIYDARVEVPAHYDTFAEFTYSYHYGDAYVPYIKQDEPLKLECQHFLDCIRGEATPITGGRAGLEVVRILEAASESIGQRGQAVALSERPVGPNATGVVPASGKTNGHNGRASGVASPAGAKNILAA
jgi:predicted dehydrogenase